MPEQISQLVEKYWVLIAIALAYWADPTILKTLISKLNFLKKPEPVSAETEESDDLELIAEVARANRRGGYGADAEIQGLFEKFNRPKGG